MNSLGFYLLCIFSLLLMSVYLNNFFFLTTSYKYSVSNFLRIFKQIYFIFKKINTYKSFYVKIIWYPFFTKQIIK